jgi:MoxR-like ATPase
VLRHRLVLSYDAVADQIPMDHIISRVMQTVPLPQVTARPQVAPAPVALYSPAAGAP